MKNPGNWIPCYATLHRGDRRIPQRRGGFHRPQEHVRRRYTGTVYPINPKYRKSLGAPATRPARSPAPADCAAVLLGSRSLLPMPEAHAAGVKGSGVCQRICRNGREGRAMQRRIHDFCPESGLLFLAAPTVGYANITDKTGMYSARSRRRSARRDQRHRPERRWCCWAPATPTAWPGSPALISSGNEAALGLADYMDYLVDDDATHVAIALFIETIRDRKLPAACSPPREKGKSPSSRSRSGARNSPAAWRRPIPGPSREATDTDAFFPPCQRHAGQHPRRPARNRRPVQRAARPFRRFARRWGWPRFPAAKWAVGGRGARTAASSSRPFRRPGRNGSARCSRPTPPSPTLDAWGSGDLREAYPASLGILAAGGGCGNAHRLAGHPRQHGPLNRWSSSRTWPALPSPRAASGKPVIVVSNISGGIDPAIGDILAQGNVPVVQGSGGASRHPALDSRRARRKRHLPTPEGFPHSFDTPPELASNFDASSGVLPYALPPPAAPFRDRHRSRGACGFA